MNHDISNDGFDGGAFFGLVATVDHPRFLELRQELVRVLVIAGVTANTLVPRGRVIRSAMFGFVLFFGDLSIHFWPSAAHGESWTVEEFYGIADTMTDRERQALAQAVVDGKVHPMEILSYYTGCQDLPYWVRLDKEMAPDVPVSEAQMRSTVINALRQAGVYGGIPTEDSKHALGVKLQIQPDVLKVNIYLYKPMRDERTQLSWTHISHTESFASSRILGDDFILIGLEARLNLFLQAYMRVNRTAC